LRVIHDKIETKSIFTATTTSSGGFLTADLIYSIGADGKIHAQPDVAIGTGRREQNGRRNGTTPQKKQEGGHPSQKEMRHNIISLNNSKANKIRQ
jgi:hypothetical protein